ncbi:MAG: hypothetical protein ACD_80C00194G0014 [uncultured bacterium (gcode 4)]|uniref:DUF2784 family protein n=1 Tax=uncultured bacterium (gcode 4) TaxID=1234023 RepID=K1X3H0_9BACT|nr:MAG: hypothetical protein ACD_80C00194G0014 [uncultured bacterium (gcode 4)]
MKIKAPKILIDSIFFLHFTIIMLRFGLFFVSSKIWPEKINYYFRFGLILVGSQFLWALIIFKRRDMICPLTTLAQYMRWHEIQDKKNYEHSFMAELLQKLRIKTDSPTANFIQKNILLLLTGIIIILKYFSLT